MSAADRRRAHRQHLSPASAAQDALARARRSRADAQRRVRQQAARRARQQADRRQADRLMGVAAEVVGADLDELRSASREPDLLLARQWLYVQLRRQGFSLPAIGRMVHRDHTTVLHGLRRAESDADVAARLADFSERADELLEDGEAGTA